MTKLEQTKSEKQSPRERARWRRARGAVVLAMGCLAVLSPFLAGTLAFLLVGILLIACGILEMLETFQASQEVERRSAYLSGALSVLAGTLPLAQPQLLLRGFSLLVAGAFLVDGIGKIITAGRNRASGRYWRWRLVGGLVNVVLALVLTTRWPVSGNAVVAIVVGFRWYDAPEAFAANFMRPDAARASMRARMEVDKGWTTTTQRSIEAKIEEAARLRREFGVSTGWQRGPFFEVQTERFALIAVDSGVLRRVDTDQWAWLTAALDRTRGKFVMVILGHPLYAGGRYQGGTDQPVAGEWVNLDGSIEVAGYRLGGEAPSFAAIHRLLREHQVEVVMAGDTHYFEHYREPYDAVGATRTMYHFVNGGGGAYMSIGTPLDWPRKPAVADCAFYPRKDALIDKLDRETPAWKKPLWLWVKHLHAWPLTAESMAGRSCTARPLTSRASSRCVWKTPGIRCG